MKKNYSDRLQYDRRELKCESTASRFDVGKEDGRFIQQTVSYVKANVTSNTGVQEVFTLLKYSCSELDFTVDCLSTVPSNLTQTKVSTSDIVFKSITASPDYLNFFGYRYTFQFIIFL